MPAHGSYQVSSWEEGKSAERDQSYRSCVLALLIFLLLCLIFILASWPWKKARVTYSHEDGASEEAQRGDDGYETTVKPFEVLPGKENFDKDERQHFGRYSNNHSTKNPIIVHPETTRTTKTIITSSATTENLDEATETSSRIQPEIHTSTRTSTISYSADSEGITDLEKSTMNFVDDTTSEPTLMNHTLKDVFTTFANCTTQTPATKEHRFVELAAVSNNYTTSETTVTNFSVTPQVTTTNENFSDFEQSLINYTTNVESRTRTNDATESATSINYTLSSESTEESFSFEETTIIPINYVTASNISTKMDDVEDVTLIFINSTAILTTPVTDHGTDKVTEIFIDNVKLLEATTSNNSIDSEVSSTTYITNENPTMVKRDFEEFTISMNYSTTLEPTTPSYDFEQFAQFSIDNFTAVENMTSNDLTESTTIPTTTKSKETQYEFKDVTATNSHITSNVMLTTPKEDNNECISGHCKQLASKMLSYMNHSADPCEDFYEYACGGLESDPQMLEKDLAGRAYHRIAKQMYKGDGFNESLQFAKYYDSCVKYNQVVNTTERIELAREALAKIGKFYNIANWPDDFQGFTNLFTNLLLHHSALLFDIIPDVNETNPNNFTLKIGPPVYKSPFHLESEQDPCYADKEETSKEHVELGKLYENYKSCKKDTGNLVKSVSEALTKLGVFDTLNNIYNISQYIGGTLINIDVELVQGFLSNYPSNNEIRQAYISKNYTEMSVGELEAACTLVNWTQLISSLTGLTVLPDTELQVYFHDEIIKGMQDLETFRQKREFELNNALLGLYARNLYQEFVIMRPNDIENYCLRVAANLLETHASSLYISSFTDEEVDYMSRRIHRLFDSLKETLRLKIESAVWTKEEGQRELLKKIQDIKLAVPEISYYKDHGLLYSDNKLHLSDNYFENSIALMKNYRKLMYSELHKNPNDPQQIWTHFAVPYQSEGRAIYGLNTVIIPFGALDLSILSNNDETSFDYLALATLGHLISHEIAHHFDAIGIHYWNHIRDKDYTLLNENDFTKNNYEKYINCHENLLYHSTIDMPLPFSGQQVFFQITKLSLNERLSDIMGLRLAYDTLTRVGSYSEKRLPWLKMNVNQLFYLAYAQMHCTKIPLTRSYVSLYQDEHLPSRLRIFVTATNNNLLGESWNCSLGSTITPSLSCNVFPYLDFNEAVITPQ